MKVLVACEFSGVVRRAFRERGHDAWSCDLLPAEDGSLNHYQGDVLDHLDEGWDLMVAHPPCTHLAVSGARWFKDKKAEQGAALDFVWSLWLADIPRICIENPVSIISTHVAKPAQIVQPWWFGHAESKATCLWLKGLPKLTPTKVLDIAPGGRWENQTPSGQNKLGPSPDRWKLRSRTYEGIAAAMADQWGGTGEGDSVCRVSEVGRESPGPSVRGALGRGRAGEDGHPQGLDVCRVCGRPLGLPAA